MTRTASPLRYPGGKAALHKLVSDLIHANGADCGHYAEPFAGGAGLALSLLFAGVVREIHLNDIDPAIAAFWRSVLNHNEQLCERINATPVTIAEWHKQKAVYETEKKGRDIDLGFATLFLNRTNRSGIIKGAGVIGGLRQEGNYLLDCRFNKPDLIRRIQRIAKYGPRIHFSQKDALKFLPAVEKRLPSNSLICADPPYYQKGSHLYTSYYKPKDHEALANVLMRMTKPWIVTYDNCDEIAALYRRRRQYEFSVQYSAQTKRTGSELLIVSRGLRIPKDLPINLCHRPSRQ